ncbi:uncharacterized protein TNCV_2154411 [Trichonephila clavipes]|nr:uncharacterized protein TNCV_2154411 [Trichonephila clavipes]
MYNCTDPVYIIIPFQIPFSFLNRGSGLQSPLPTALVLLKRKICVPFQHYPSACGTGLRCPVVKVSDHDRHVTSSSSVPLKTCRVVEQCVLNLSRAQTSSRWCGLVVRRGECQLRCHPRHLIMIQNYEVRVQKPSCS